MGFRVRLRQFSLLKIYLYVQASRLGCNVSLFGLRHGRSRQCSGPGNARQPCRGHGRFRGGRRRCVRGRLESFGIGRRAVLQPAIGLRAINGPPRRAPNSGRRCRQGQRDLGCTRYYASRTRVLPTLEYIFDRQPCRSGTSRPTKWASSRPHSRHEPHRRDGPTIGWGTSHSRRHLEAGAGECRGRERGHRHLGRGIRRGRSGGAERVDARGPGRGSHVGGGADARGGRRSQPHGAVVRG
jgi:hypothetical protein